MVNGDLRDLRGENGGGTVSIQKHYLCGGEDGIFPTSYILCLITAVKINFQYIQLKTTRFHN